MGGCSNAASRFFPGDFWMERGESWEIGGIACECFATQGGNIMSMFHDPNARVFNNKRYVFS